MKKKGKVNISLSIFMFLVISGGLANQVLTNDMLERHRDEEQYQGFLLGDDSGIDIRFRPRQYIKMVPREGNEQVD